MNLSKEGCNMNENKSLIYDDEKAISLISLCLYLLSKWKLMVVAGVVLAIAAGGFTYMESSKAAKASVKELSIEEVEASFATEDALMAAKNKIEKINEYKQNLEEREFYLENSIMIKLDPNGYYEGKLTYVVSGVDEQEVLKNAALLKGMILSEENFEKITEALNDTKDTALLKEVVVDETVYITNCAEVVVKARHYEKEECEKILEYLKKDIPNVELVGEQINIKLDNSLIGFSTDMINAKNAMYDSMKNLENSMSALEKTYYEMLENPDVIKEPVVVVEPSVDLKLVTIAAVAGVFCVSGLYGVFYLLGGLVHTKEELESWIAVPVVNMESKMEMNATMLAGIVGERNVEKIFITSSIGAEKEPFMKELFEALGRKNIEVVIGDNILDDPSALQEAVEVGAMVLVEKCYRSKEKAIREAILKATSCGIRVCGVILEK